MLHARADGETFGLAIAEFSMHNKPVITACPTHICHDATSPPTRLHEAIGKHKFQAWYEHVRLLGANALRYANESALLKHLHNFDRVAAAHRDWNMYGNFTSEKVMRKFEAVFLPNVTGSVR